MVDKYLQTLDYWGCHLARIQNKNCLHLQTSWEESETSEFSTCSLQPMGWYQYHIVCQRFPYIKFLDIDVVGQVLWIICKIVKQASHWVFCFQPLLLLVLQKQARGTCHQQWGLYASFSGWRCCQVETTIPWWLVLEFQAVGGRQKFPPCNFMCSHSFPGLRKLDTF